MSALRTYRKSLPWAWALENLIIGSFGHWGIGAFISGPGLWGSGEIVGSFAAERKQMPAVPLDERPRQRVERADEQAVIDGALPTAVQPRFHGKAFRHDAHLAEGGNQSSQFRIRGCCKFNSTGASSCSNRTTFITLEKARSARKSGCRPGKSRALRVCQHPVAFIDKMPLRPGGHAGQRRGRRR